MILLQQLERVLDEERRLLLGGRIDHLENLSEVKEKLLERISLITSTLPNDAIRRISRKAKRNEELLKSAQRGIKSALMHINEAADGAFKSYSKEGQRKPLSKPLTLKQKI